MKKKIIWINIIIAIFIYIVSGLTTAILIAKPINLTNEETKYFIETAENVWYNGLQSVEPDNDLIIRFNLNDETVHVSSTANKQSITVDFSNNEKEIIVNDPNVSFIGCFFFYGFLWTGGIYFVVGFITVFIKDSQYEKKIKENIKEKQN